MSGEGNTFECVVSADLFRRALLGVSTEETRYYLNGVHVSPAAEGGAALVATNGSFLIAMHDPEAYIQGEGIVMLGKQLKSTLKAGGILLERRLLIIRGKLASDDQKAFVVDVAAKGIEDAYSPYLEARALFDAPDKRVCAAQFGPVLIDGKFPDWRHALPAKLDPKAPIPVFNEAMLSRAVEALSEHKMRNVQLTSSGPNNPILITSRSQTFISGFAILMPLRTEATAAAVPAWANLPTAVAA